MWGKYLPTRRLMCILYTSVGAKAKAFVLLLAGHFTATPVVVVSVRIQSGRFKRLTVVPESAFECPA